MISIDEEIDQFSIHLENNDRVIFSARFGDGKSYFLDQFKEQFKNTYLFLTLYPVTYPVAENKDILEYIKRDIAIQLMANEDIAFEQSDLPTNLLRQQYILNSSYDLVKDLLSCTKLAKPASIFFKHLEQLKEYKDTMIVQGDEDDVLQSYLTDMADQKGSIYEFDTISQLITNIIQRYRETYPKKKVVLIIEDLDRIDPGHIFRILNIFSAHIDQPCYSFSEREPQSYPNKFSFDKIITVCHYENIESIFHHLYGPKTDFKGYIDKFKSGIPFRYSLQDKITEHIRQNIDKLFQDHPLILNIICTLIIDKYKQRYASLESSNLREIDRILHQDINYIIKEEIIPIPNNEYQISTKNNVSKLLALLHHFGIPRSEIISKIEGLNGYEQQNHFKALIQYMDVALLLSDQIHVIDINNNSLYIKESHDRLSSCVLRTNIQYDNTHIRELRIDSIQNDQIIVILYSSISRIFESMDKYIL